MKLLVFVLMAISLMGYSQNLTRDIQGFKGEHFVLYNKCLSALIFCENTQQTYNFCTSYNNCYGLYVMPGDTFYVNLEDKNQAETISADISFTGYFPTLTNVIFLPVNNNFQCIPPHPLQIVIPLNAALGTIFQIQAQNTAYVNVSSNTPTIPLSIEIQIGGIKSQLMSSLSDFTVCPQTDESDTTQVMMNEISELRNKITISPNPIINNLEINLPFFQTPINYEISDFDGTLIKRGQVESTGHQVQLNSLAAGLYFISFISSDILFETKKIVVIK